MHRPKVDTELWSPLVKDIANFTPYFNEHVREHYPLHMQVYTDGSKDAIGVGDAAVYGVETLSNKGKGEREVEGTMEQTENPIEKIKPDPSPSEKLTLTSHQGVILNRLRIGHTHLTHSYLMDNSIQQLPPPCQLCNNQTMTIEHLLIHCPNLIVKLT